MDGVINILKPPGLTSHDVVLKLRRLLGIQKIGHTGTLDPGAAGVLPICVGKGTKIAEFLMDQQKSYRGEMVLGINTDTGDAGGKIIENKGCKDFDHQLLTKVVNSFLGEIKQIPPMFSAAHFQGKRLYKLARQGITVTRKARRIIVYSFQILKIENGVYPRVIFDISCSKGTYVRGICEEIGKKLKCGAYLSFLIRTASGPFVLQEAWPLEEIFELVAKKDFSFLLPVDFPLQEIPALTVKEKAVINVLNGNALAPSGIKGALGNSNPPQFVRLYSPDGILLAFGKKDTEPDGKWLYKPKKVFNFWKKQ